MASLISCLDGLPPQVSGGVNGGVNGEGEGSSSDMAYVMPTLLIALKGLLKLLLASGERGQRFQAEAEECGTLIASDVI
jgi:hypothetical protein